MESNRIEIDAEIFREIQVHGETHYPEEGAGLLLGQFIGEHKRITAILKLTNSREEDARHNRYLLTPKDYVQGEMEAEQLGLEVLGVFHSHPDHPSRPSEFDREWAMPWFSYIITSVQNGKAVSSHSWLLAEDRSHFEEEAIDIVAERPQIPVQKEP